MHRLIALEYGRVGFGEGDLWFGRGVAFEVAGVLGVGVVTPLVRPGSLVVPDGERGDPGFEVLAGGEVAAAQAARGLLCLRDCRLPCQRRESDELGEESIGFFGGGG